MRVTLQLSKELCWWVYSTKFITYFMYCKLFTILRNLVASQVLFKTVIIRLGHIAYIFRFVDKKFLNFLRLTGACKAYSWSIDILFAHPWGESIIVTCNTWHSWATCKIFILYLCFCAWRNAYFIFLNFSGYKTFKFWTSKVQLVWFSC